MSRPHLHHSLSSTEFAAWYWLKKELIDFCRTVGLPASGSKQEIAQRIALWLDGKAPPTILQPRKRDVMPVIFELTTVVGTGWRLTKALRGFFENECGKRFHFNGALREFFATQVNAGKTLADAVKVYQDSLQKNAITTIAPQFEYNRHCRDFFANHPGATRAEAIAAWKKKRHSRHER